MRPRNGSSLLTLALLATAMRDVNRGGGINYERADIRRPETWNDAMRELYREEMARLKQMCPGLNSKSRKQLARRAVLEAAAIGV